MALKDFLKKIIGNVSEPPEHFVNGGSTGTQVFSGIYDEEYLDKFKNMPDGMDIYDKMRRSDYQIQMLLSGVKNPIVAANWGVEAVDHSDEEKEIADFVKFVLFDDIGYTDGSKYKTWRDFLIEALTAVDFGYSLFEPVYKVVMGDPRWGNYVGLRDIAFRSQKTIYEWNLNKNGSINYVRQQVDGDLAVDVNIPGENLLTITFKKEGDNYEGISMLRPLYGNWLRKDFYFKIQAMGIERCAIGVMVGKVPVDAQNDAAQMSTFKEILKRFTSHQSDYMVIPTGFEIDIEKIDFDANAVEESINSEDRRMSKSFLAGFLELGLGKSGSQALGKELSGVFLKGIEIYSEIIADAVERSIVTKIVDARYGKRQRYPQIKATDITNKGGKDRAEIAVMLKNAGLIRDSDQLEDNLNRDFDFPVITSEQKEADSLMDKGRNPDIKRDPKKELEKANVKKKLSEGKHIKLAEDDNPSVFVRNRSKGIHLLMQTSLVAATNAYLEKINTKFKMETNVSKRRSILEDTPIPGKRDYRNKLRLDMASISQEAMRRVLKELGMQNVKFDEFTDILKTLPLAMRNKLRTNVDAVVDDQYNELDKRMFFIASQKLDTTDSVDALIKDMKQAADRYTTDSGVLGVAATNSVSGNVNSTRNAVFQTPEVFEEIESFIIVNPSPEAPICKNLQGRVFSKEDYKTQPLPPYHHNCETTVRAQLKGQKKVKPTNPIGLTPTGTEKEVAAIIKSKTFDESGKTVYTQDQVDDMINDIKLKDGEIKTLKEKDTGMDNLIKAISGED